jgi:lysophospholipase L1-like esterase
VTHHILSGVSLANAVHGELETEIVGTDVIPRRLPRWTRTRQADAGMERVSAQTSGVHLRLVTTARVIYLEATFTRTTSPAHPARPFSLVTESPTADCVLIVDEGDLLYEAADGTAARVRGTRSRLTFVLDVADSEREVTLWLPTSAGCVLHLLSADAPVRPVRSHSARWLHYGSSISHGSDLTDPRAPWPQQVARALNLDLVNLGFAGNAMLDPFVARVIAEAPADLVTLKIGINLVNGDAMRSRTFIPAVHGFLDQIRAGHPTAPLAVITALACPIHEHTTGPTRQASPGMAGATPREIPSGDGSLTLSRTRELISKVVETREDSALYLIDGLGLLTPEDGHLPDNLHPDEIGHSLIASRFAPHARRLLDL